jgi:hypothetical protein
METFPLNNLAGPSFSMNLGSAIPRDGTRGARPRPVPARFQRDHQADLMTTKTGIAKHFSR